MSANLDLIFANKRYFHSTISKYAKKSEDIDDIFQEFVVRVLRMDHIDLGKARLGQVAAWTALKQISYRKFKMFHYALPMSKLDKLPIETDLEQKMELEELINNVKAQVAKLPKKTRFVISARHDSELEFSTVLRNNGINVSTGTQLYRSGLAKLKKHYKRG